LVNAKEFRGRFALLLLAALVLTTAAWLRSAEYDEQYTLFVTAGTPRPDWPAAAFPAGDVALVQAGHATLGGIARDLRTTDVHPPLYFWTVSLWRLVFGPSLFAARMLSVLCGTVSIALVGIIAHRCDVRPVVAMSLTLGCYGFVYTNAIARGFAMAEMLTLGGVALLLGGRSILAGVCLGAACCCNYLAVFVGGAALLVAEAWAAIPAVTPFLALDAWFFVAQHSARVGQFPPFAAWPSVVRLAEYQVAARVVAGEAARLASDAVVLVPAGNDGVGIVGAFGIEAAPELPILLIRPGDPISDRVAPYRRVGLALLAEDRDSTAAIAAARNIFTQPNWRRVEIGSNFEVFERGE
jgi:hypothetical protein